MIEIGSHGIDRRLNLKAQASSGGRSVEECGKTECCSDKGILEGDFTFHAASAASVLPFVNAAALRAFLLRALSCDRTSVVGAMFPRALPSAFVQRAIHPSTLSRRISTGHIPRGEIEWRAIELESRSSTVMAVSKKNVQKTPVRLEDQLGFALYSASLAMTKAHKPMLDKLGLTYSQYLAMVVLWEQDDIAVNQLGARLGLDSGTLTPLLKRLESMGLLTRRRGEADERQVFIDLTPRGVNLRREARHVPAQIQAATGQSDTAQKTLRNLLLQLRDALSDV